MVTVNKAKFLLMLQGQTIEHHANASTVRHMREELKKLFTEKPLLIFEMRHLRNEEWFQTDLPPGLWLFEKSQ